MLVIYFYITDSFIHIFAMGAEFFDYYVFELVTKDPDRRHDNNQQFSGSMDRYRAVFVECGFWLKRFFGQ